MTREKFDILVRKLEGFSRKHPRLYTARIVALVVLAYAYLLLVLVGSFVLMLAMIPMVIYAPITLKFALVGLFAFGGIFWSVLRGLWVKIARPTGQEITREQAPELFRMLDELRSALDCRPFHKVLIAGNMNAAVYQVPRLGIFGWHTNYLMIGLPLMQSLAPDEFKAVMAHEFAHSSRGHGRFGNWLYRVRRTWEQVFEQMAKRRTRFGSVLFKFINWFWPVFNGHAFVLARANEYEADACSVRLAGADAAASALMRLPVNESVLNDKFWPGIFDRVKLQKQPPADVMVSQGVALKTGLDADEAQKRVRQSFLMETNNADTHPCLKDRLRAINRLPAGLESEDTVITPPAAPVRTAAEVLLGEQAEVLASRLSEDWSKAIATYWAERHEHAQKLALELAALEKSNEALTTSGQLWEKALKIIQLHSDKEALPVIEQVLTLEPAHPGANLVLGRYRLGIDDGSGAALIESAMDTDIELIQNGCNLLYAYYQRTGQRDKIKNLEDRMDRFREVTVLAQRERARITAADTFIPHELTETQLEELRKIFTAEPDIGSVAIARKKVEHFKVNPCFAVGLTVKVPWWKLRSSASNIKLVNRVVKQIKLPGYFLIFVNEKNRKTLWNRISDAPEAMVYRRVRKK